VGQRSDAFHHIVRALPGGFVDVEDTTCFAFSQGVLPVVVPAETVQLGLIRLLPGNVVLQWAQDTLLSLL
jgi:hypothetical protein